MSKYLLLDKEIVFSDSADRYCSLQFFAWDAVKKAEKEFDEWYVKQGNIYNVLKNFSDEVESLLEKHTLIPLYKTLASDYEIYDLSQNTYNNQCLDLSEAKKVHDFAIEIYESIEEKLEEEKEYREFRKANRSEVIGGGFGVGGMIAGMATAGAINMTTGAAHSIANSIGNAGSNSDANVSKAQLYSACRDDMAKAIESCILSTAYAHTSVVNKYIPEHIVSTFDSEKSGALLESAKSVEAKRGELIVDAFKSCPWNYELYSYVFEKYPNERKNLIKISKNFRVDLENDITKLLSREYSSDAKKSEELALKAKAKILKIMKELDISESVIIDEIENDCLARICSGYEKADEKTCNAIVEKIEKYDALDKNKQSFVKKIRSRIEEIWTNEDGEKFDNYLLNMKKLDSEEIIAVIGAIEEQGRTENAKKYIAALEMFKNSKNIRKARKYRYCAKQGMSSKLLRWSGAIIAILGFILYMAMDTDEMSFWLHGLPMLGGVGLQIYISSLKSVWDKLTLDNKVVHPVLTMGKEQYINFNIENYNKTHKSN